MSLKFSHIAFILCFVFYLGFSLLAVIYSHAAPGKGVLFGALSVGFLALYYLGSTVNEVMRRRRFRSKYPRLGREFVK